MDTEKSNAIGVQHGGTVKDMAAGLSMMASAFVFSAVVAAGARFGNDWMVRRNERKYG